MAESEHEIKVTLRDVYETVEKQGKELAAMNGKLDLYIGLNTVKDDKLKDHENRIRTVERWVFALPGTAMVLSVAGLVIAVIKG